MDIDDKITVYDGQEFEFVHYALHTLLGDNSSLGHFFHSKLFTAFLFAFYAPYFSEATSTYSVDLCKVCFAYLRYRILVLCGFEVAVAHY